MTKIKWFLVLCLILLLFYTRFVNLHWGLPYPFHPDERNIADAVIRLHADDLFKPTFYAYGQLSIYLAYIISVISNVIRQVGVTPVGFEQAIVSLRFISAMASIGVIYFGIKIIRLFKISYLSTSLKLRGASQSLVSTLLLIFSPALIQFAHFGTTESLLMMFYTAITYYSIKMVAADDDLRSRYLYIAALLVGMAAATKVSSLLFAPLPACAFIFTQKSFQPKNVIKPLSQLIVFAVIMLIVLFVFSPYNFLAFKDFMGSFAYESDVALGRSMVFYTRQFLYSVPILFQSAKVFPYALGWPLFVAFVIGFVALPWNKSVNMLRASFLLFFLPASFLYAKWARFMAPALPVMIILGSLGMLGLVGKIRERIRFKNEMFANLSFYSAFFLIVLLVIVPGVAYLSIYTQHDVRFKASEWIYKNISNGSYVLSETANVVDIPISPPNNQSRITNNYQYISFNFFDVDDSLALQEELQGHIQKADYIFVMSRRVYANHTCFGYQKSDIGYQKDRCEKLQKQYPILNDYYKKLFSGELGFRKVAEFTSYPRLEIGTWNLEIRDERSEETWTVFDHPVIRIYKKV